MPKCPMNSAHGPLFSWDRPPSHDPWYCGHSDHGGNGLFVTNAMLGGEDVANQIEEVLSAILEGTLSIDEAVNVIARRSNYAITDIRNYVETRMRIARNFAEAKTARVEARTVSLTPRKRRDAVPSVSAAEFMRVMMEANLSKKEAAEAIGRSVSRVHELTVTQGGNQKLFDNFVAKLGEYLASRKEDGGQ